MVFFVLSELRREVIVHLVNNLILVELFTVTF